jgi:hypothetical protein
MGPYMYLFTCKKRHEETLLGRNFFPCNKKGPDQQRSRSATRSVDQRICLHYWAQPKKCKDLVGSCSPSPPSWRSAQPRSSVLTGTAFRCPLALTLALILALTLALTLALILALTLLALLPTPAARISCDSARSASTTWTTWRRFVPCPSSRPATAIENASNPPLSSGGAQWMHSSSADPKILIHLPRLEHAESALPAPSLVAPC